MNMVYFHYRNKKPYVKVGKAKIQENGKWIDAVLYTELGKKDIYVRSEKEFNEKFSEELQNG